MFRKALPFCGVLLLAGAVSLLAPEAAQARGGGGFHGGGFHGGGFHGGGFHGGFGGFHGGRFGGFHDGFHGGFHPHYRSFHNYGGYYPYSYGYYPYYNSYSPYDYGSYSSSDYYPYNYDYSPYYGSSSDSGGNSGDSSSSSQAFPSYSTTPAPTQADTGGRLTVNVPADAEVWIGGWKVPTTGTAREFTLPPLTPGKRYTYDVRARWKENGREVTQEQKVRVAAGANASVDFPARPGTTGTMPAAK